MASVRHFYVYDEESRQVRIIRAGTPRTLSNSLALVLLDLRAEDRAGGSLDRLALELWEWRPVRLISAGLRLVAVES